MTGSLFLNGAPGKYSLADISGTFVICADGAYNYIKDRIKPDLLIGDFDSIDLTNLPLDVETLKFPSKKDYTDGQLAVQEAAKRGIKQLTIYGAFGGRIDQVFVNYSLLKLASSLGMQAHLVSDEFWVYGIRDKFEGAASVGKIISLAPYGDSIHIISTEGLAYPAHGLLVGNDLITSISNQALGGRFFVHVDGFTLLFIER